MFLSRSGFIVVAICFALPWIGLECSSSVKVYSGFELFGEGYPGTILLLAFVFALAGLVATWKIFGPKSKNILSAASILSPLIFIIGLLAFLQKLGSTVGISFGDTVKAVAEDMIKKPQWTYGLWGVLIGYIFVLLGIPKKKQLNVDNVKTDETDVGNYPGA